MATASQTKTPEFGKWRSIFWPVHGYELKKLIPMLFLFFFINFNYTVLRDTKDTLIVTSCGAEAIPFLKVWGVLPFAVLFMLIYSKLSNKMSRQKLFYATLTPFIAFFALFVLVLFPNKDLLHPTQFAETLKNLLPDGYAGLAAAIKNWTFSLFYIMAELWGSVGISLLFWGFANDITKVSESKRFYALFGIGANVSMLISGPLIVFFSNIRNKVPEGVDPWGVTLNYLMGMVVISGLLALWVYRWINKNVLSNPKFYDPTQVKKSKKKPKMSMKESFKFLLTSKYILCLAILVIAYGVAINLVEVTWKAQLRLQYPNSNEYSAFMGYYSTFIGLTTIIMMLFVGGNVIRRLGWTTGAVFTPAILALTGFGFFAFVIFKNQLTGLVAYIGTSPLMIAVMIGTVQNIMSKSCKYSLFDPTKEMAYIPLDQESKVKGKAAIDVVGARLGKSGGSLVQQVLLLIGPLAVITPYIAVVLGGIIFAWIIAAKLLGKQFKVAVDAQQIALEAEAAAAKEEVPAKEEPATAKEKPIATQ